MRLGAAGRDAAWLPGDTKTIGGRGLILRTAGFSDGATRAIAIAATTWIANETPSAETRRLPNMPLMRAPPDEAPGAHAAFDASRAS